jgi:RNA polymerase sigma factor (sigma-70 family)
MSDAPSPLSAFREFRTTHWSVVLQAAGTQSEAAASALESLCTAYWYPLYAHVRRMGFAPADAEDLTQAFFARLLERNTLAEAREQRGRFRSFLLASLRHFVSDELDRAKAWKRGGRALHVTWDALAAEARFDLEPSAPGNLEEYFDQLWASEVLARARRQLHAEAAAADRLPLLESLLPTEARPGPEETYADIGARLGLSEGAVKLAAFRLRQRYREHLRAEVAQTVPQPEDVEDELRHLMTVVSRASGAA